MDDLLQEFLGETGEHLETVDRELVRFEREPNNRDILLNIFRLVHTVKGTCGFIGLPRLEALAHAAESVIGQFRDGASVDANAVTAILETIDRIKEIIVELSEKGQEPPGDDARLIGDLRALAEEARQQLSATGQKEAGDDAVALYLARHRQEPAAPAAQDDLDLVFRAAPPPPPEPAPVERDPRKAGPHALRVDVDKLEHLMTMVSELVLTRNQLLEIARQSSDQELKAPLQRLSLITAELQDGVMKTRMQPIGNAWSKLPRIVRDLSAELGKKIDLATEGADTEVDRQILDLIKDPLTHMVRNCADHAIETPEERRLAGKRENGTIRLSARHEGGAVIIAVSDDGRGLDLKRIRLKALQHGLVSQADLERMSDAQVARLIFSPGFSTSDRVTAISGRGVGMDVVKVNVDATGGTVDVATVAGQGTTITVKIPLTLAIVATLVVSVGGRRFAIPQLSVRELVRVTGDGDHRIERIDATPVMRLREQLLPIVALDTLMGRRDTPLESGFAVVVQVGERQFGLLVDAVSHTEEIVVKPMSSKLRHIPLFSGNTILGDGTVVLIIDPNGIARMIGALASPDLLESAQEAAAPAEPQTTLLVLRAGLGLKAVPLTLIARLEEVDTAQFETSGNRTMLNYHGRLMPVLPVIGAQIRPEGLQALVIVRDGDLLMGLAVDEIVDIVDETLDIQMLSLGEPGVLGSAVIRGRATAVIDIAYYLPQAHPGWTGVRGAGTPDARPLRALLVEPSTFLSEMLTPVLKALGLAVSTAGTAEEAAALVQRMPFEAVLIDLDGDTKAARALALALRSGANGAPRRVVGLSALVTRELQADAAEAGFDSLLGKFDRHALIAEMTESRQRLRRAA